MSVRLLLKVSGVDNMLVVKEMDAVGQRQGGEVSGFSGRTLRAYCTFFGLSL